jgi:hypothetical protein
MPIQHGAVLRCRGGGRAGLLQMETPTRRQLARRLVLGKFCPSLFLLFSFNLPVLLFLKKIFQSSSCHFCTFILHAIFQAHAFDYFLSFIIEFY